MLQFVQKYIINKRKGLINKRKPEEMVCYSIGVYCMVCIAPPPKSGDAKGVIVMSNRII
jgi:hypothetical protein